jgi:glycylpeptide N-tetradecanoyltransferase
MNFMLWNFTHPNLNQEYLLGVRTSQSKKLVGFIAGIPMKINIRDSLVDLLEIKFLCVLPKLQNKRLTPVLISELKRRASLNGIK